MVFTLFLRCSYLRSYGIHTEYITFVLRILRTIRYAYIHTCLSFVEDTARNNEACRMSFIYLFVILYSVRVTHAAWMPIDVYMCWRQLHTANQKAKGILAYVILKSDWPCCWENREDRVHILTGIILRRIAVTPTFRTSRVERCSLPLPIGLSCQGKIPSNTPYRLLVIKELGATPRP